MNLKSWAWQRGAGRFPPRRRYEVFLGKLPALFKCQKIRGRTHAQGWIAFTESRKVQDHFRKLCGSVSDLVPGIRTCFHLNGVRCASWHSGLPTILDSGHMNSAAL